MGDLKICSFGYKGEDLSLCVTENKKRKYIKVKGLINPKRKKWNGKEQRFDDASKDAIHNNQLLTQMLEAYNTVLDMCPNISTKEDLVEACSKLCTIEDRKTITLGEYIKRLISDMKNGTYDKPSRNFQTYLTLLHSMEKQNTIINKPISDINNGDYRNYGTWLNDCLKSSGTPQNYKGKMKRLHATIIKAQKQGFNNNAITYNASWDIPSIEKKREKRHSLTKSQYDRFVNMDLNTIQLGGGNTMYYKTLYRDFCIVICEYDLRPVDLLKLNWNDIKKSDGLSYFELIPEKKKNSECAKSQIVYLDKSKRAQKILEKYRGKSPVGYVFPFAMNQKRWNLEDPKVFKMFDNRKEKTLGAINRFLKKIAPEIGFKFDFVLYTFRHTGITFEVSENKFSTGDIATMAGTSIDMIDKTYHDGNVSLHNRIMNLYR